MMPSIRKSLIAYFLLLLAVAFVGVGVIVDAQAKDALRGREEAEKNRIEKELEAKKKTAKEEFERGLLLDAQMLGRELREKYNLLARRDVEESTKRFRTHMALMALGDLGSPLAMTFAYAEANSFPVRNAVYWSYFSSPLTDERIRKSFAEDVGEYPKYFQLHIPRLRRTIRGPEQPFDFPANVEKEQLIDSDQHYFDEVTIPKVGVLTRVVYRTNLIVPRNNFFPGPNGTGTGTGGGTRGRSGGFNPPMQPPPQNPRSEQESIIPTVYVHTARPKSELLDQYDLFDQQRTSQIERVSLETAASLTQLRWRMGYIAAGTFIALALGGWLLVGLGLFPLRKLSDAVSRVSEKDFRLPIEKRELSTELAPIHDRLTQSLDALRRAFEREKEAVADISHELRTPVAGLLATIDVSLRKVRTADQYRVTLEECRAIVKQMGNLVERVMTLAYLDAGQSVMQHVSTNASDVAEECAAVIRPLAESHGVTLTAKLESPTDVNTDPDKLREVIMNLLHNAVEYSHTGGNVQLSVRKESNSVRVEVADNGIGMSPEIQGKIFERFFRADPSRTTTGAHAGLGLAIVKEYVTRLGGTIAVESQAGHGSTFKVTLPT